MDSLLIGRKTYKIEKKTRELHDFCEYLVSFKNQNFIAKKYELTSKMIEDVKSRKNLKKYGINVPKYYKVDKKNNVTLEQFIEGKNVLDELLKNDLDDSYFKELFNIYRFCRFSKIDLDYLPENFLLTNKKMFYLAFNYKQADQNSSLEDYGMYYWIYSSELAQHLKDLGIEVDKKRIIQSAEVKKKIVLLSIMNW